MTDEQMKMAALGRYLEMCSKLASELKWDGIAEYCKDAMKFAYDELAEDYCRMPEYFAKR